MMTALSGLAPCPYRESDPGRAEFSCRLAQQLLGLSSAEPCRVESAACALCLRAGPPAASLPSPVVSSLVYNLARRIRGEGGWPDCDVGQAWQAECYVRPTLAAGEVERPRLSRWRWPFGRWIAPRQRARASSRPVRIGLVGYDTASGLGHINQDLAERGLVDAWLQVDHSNLPRAAIPGTNDDRSRRLRAGDDRGLRHWLRDLDWVVWVERCGVDSLPQLARQAGVRLACVPMWEWMSPLDSSLKELNLLICPTRHSAEMFQGWRRRFALPWRVAEFPWPIAVDRFPFRQRDVCRRFVYVNGHGGSTARALEGSEPLGPRKGLDLVLTAARRAPEIPWTIHTQVEIADAPPANVEVKGETSCRSELFADGDVCVQPSRWEGLGLPLLECQAAGLPLVVLDASPMNECRPLRRIPADRRQWGYLVEGQPMSIPEATADALVAAVRDLHGRDIRQASWDARDWVRRERSWEVAAGRWRGLFEDADRAEMATC